MVHAGAEFAERIADALECRARLLFEGDAAFVRRQWHADLAGNEDPGAGPRIDAQCLAEGRRDRTRYVFEKIHGVTPNVELFGRRLHRRTSGRFPLTVRYLRALAMRYSAFAST